MTFLVLQPLSAALLPAALALDQRCFGGLWTLDGYQRELESPNSELLVLIEEPEAGEPGSRGKGKRENLKLKLKQPSGSIQGSQNVDVSAQPHSVSRRREHRSNLKTPLSSSPAKLLFPSIPHFFPLAPRPSPLLGLGCYWAILEEAHITMLAIDPAYQRQGLGQALLYALLVSAHARGLERATLEVRVSNQTALSLYQKFDFREAGRRRCYYPDDGEDALVLWRGGIQTPEFSERLKVWNQQVCDRLCTVGWQLSID